MKNLIAMYLDPIVIGGIALVVFIFAIIFIFRPLLTWLHSIDDVIKNQKKTNKTLDEILELLQDNMQSVEKNQTWVCSNCSTENSIDHHYCKKCKQEYND